MTSRGRTELRLSGAGGQGLITAGVILAEAAVLEGMNVVQTQSYGPEARLGASRAEVILSREEIAYPQVTRPDILLCLSQDAFERYSPDVKPDGLIVVDATNVEMQTPSVAAEIYAYPITTTAVELGSKVVANVVALGALCALTDVVSAEHLEEAVLKRVPERFRDLNARALEAGQALIERAAATPGRRETGRG